MFTVPPVRHAVYMPATWGPLGMWGPKMGYPATIATITATRPVIMAISWSRVSLLRKVKLKSIRGMARGIIALESRSCTLPVSGPEGRMPMLAMIAPRK